MKRFLKFGAVLTALILALTCFVACKDDDSSSGASVVTSWKYTHSGTGKVDTITFYDNNTCRVEIKAKVASDSSTLTVEGKYDGDTKSNGTVKMTVEKVSKTGNYFDNVTIKQGDSVNATISDNNLNFQSDIYTKQ